MSYSFWYVIFMLSKIIESIPVKWKSSLVPPLFSVFFWSKATKLGCKDLWLAHLESYRVRSCHFCYCQPNDCIPYSILKLDTLTLMLTRMWLGSDNKELIACRKGWGFKIIVLFSPWALKKSFPLFYFGGDHWSCVFSLFPFTCGTNWKRVTLRQGLAYQTHFSHFQIVLLHTYYSY